MLDRVRSARVAVEPPRAVVHPPEDAAPSTAVVAAGVPEPTVEDQHATGGRFDRKFGRACLAQRGVAVGVRTRFMSTRSNDRRPIFAGEIGEHPKGRKIDDQIGQRTLDMRSPGLAPGPVDVQVTRYPFRSIRVGVAEIAAAGDDPGTDTDDRVHDREDPPIGEKGGQALVVIEKIAAVDFSRALIECFFRAPTHPIDLTRAQHALFDVKPL